MKYFFTLGIHPELSISEIKAKLEQKNILYSIITRHDSFFVIETETEIDLIDILNQLGGTIKIGEVVEEVKMINQSDLLHHVKVKDDKKNSFGISGYNCENDFKRVGLGIKKELKNKGFSMRYVDSKENPLSSVIVQKEILKKDGTELCLLKSNNTFLIGKTVAVQDFQKYSHFDYDRPESDSKKGMLPPKLAQIMINLAEKNISDIIYDPFCGNGTILQQAILLGHKKVIGSDNDEAQIDKTTKNLAWLKENLKKEKVDFSEEIFQADASHESKLESKSIDFIVTEPFLGPPLKGYETEGQIRKNILQLEHLYENSFTQFNKLLRNDGVIIMIIPSFYIQEKVYHINISKLLPKNFTIIKNWQYSRENQKVIRNIYKIDKK
ncbi:methyltransferase domain-containing protein [Candidatus Falkowbacteria bacterium]|jgi:tRNA G10  N-methylase Trm11|nr:methyltransferase domain-containing protein [Candidatus Falkowbacteria bacterium]MBT7006983.1 methyltransferase domain-containing protein [Candidatus Falkowbacteria bacterium]